MVRKWSYIIQYVSIKAKNIKLVKNLPRRHVLKVFKGKTRFKRAYSNFITKFSRLIYRRRKSISNWLPYGFVLYYWVRSFLKSKQFIRFYQNIGLLNYQFHSSTTCLINKISTKATSKLVYNSFSCSSNIIDYFMPQFSSYKIPLIPYSGTVFFSKSNITSSFTLNPGVLASDNSFFTISMDVNDGVDWESPTNYTYLSFLNSFVYFTLKYVPYIYIIYVHLTLRNLSTLNYVIKTI